MKKSKILFTSTIIGLSLLPIVFRRKYRTQSLIIFGFSAVTNTLISNRLIEKGYFRFPTRYYSKIFRSNIVYDWLVGPLFAVAYCQTTAGSSLKGMLRQSIIYSAFQAIVEYWVLVKTNLIEYNKKKWSIWHSFMALILFKVLLIRGMWTLVGRLVLATEKK